MTKFRYPTPEEINAIERAARRAQAREMARLFALAMRAVKSAGLRAISLLAAKRVGHA